MAKKKDNEEVKISFDQQDEKTKKKIVEKAFEQLNEFSNLCTWLSDAQSNIDSFEDTGCYILNALLSGYLRGGFPEGRMSVMAAESSVGKSYIALRTAALAQASGKFVLIMDSEYAIDKDFASNLGVDASRTRYIPVKTIEQCKNALYKFLNYVIENGLQGKFLVIVDSLANMMSELDMSRAEKDSAASDMGTRARAMKSFLQMCINMSGQSKTTIICTNHIYDNPNALHPSIVKPQPGGKCVTYLPSTVLQLSATNVKEGDDRKIDEEATVGGKGLLGKAITGLSIKNRVCKPFVTANMYISWKKGLAKYFGLIELSQDFGLIFNRGGYFYLEDNEKNRKYLKTVKGIDESKIDKEIEKRIGSRKDLLKDAEFWESYLDTIQERLTEEWHYTSYQDQVLGERIAEKEINGAYGEKEEEEEEIL